MINPRGGETVNCCSDTITSFESPSAGAYAGICGTNVTIYGSYMTGATIPNASFKWIGQQNTITVNTNTTYQIPGAQNHIYVNGGSNGTFDNVNFVHNFTSSDYANLRPASDTTIYGSGQVGLTGQSNTTTTLRASDCRVWYSWLGTSGPIAFNVYGNNNYEDWLTPAGYTGGSLDMRNFGTNNKWMGTIVADSTGIKTNANPPAQQSGGCTHTWLVTEIWYIVQTGQIISSRQYTISDPVVLNLHGTGIETQPLFRSCTFVDMDGDGVPDRTGWGAAGSAYLVVAGDDGRAPASIGIDQLVKGFDQLRSIAAPGAHLLKQGDVGWDRLFVWCDNDGSGKYSASAARSLDELGIVSISLDTIETTRGVNGNFVTALSDIAFHDGHHGSAGSVAFSYEGQQTPDADRELARCMGEQTKRDTSQ